MVQMKCSQMSHKWTPLGLEEVSSLGEVSANGRVKMYTVLSACSWHQDFPLEVQNVAVMVQ